MVYKNQQEHPQQDNFSFEIENTNNMVVPNNIAQPIRDINFV